MLAKISTINHEIYHFEWINEFILFRTCVKYVTYVQIYVTVIFVHIKERQKSPEHNTAPSVSIFPDIQWWLSTHTDSHIDLRMNLSKQNLGGGGGSTQNIADGCEVTWLRFQLEHSEQTIVAPTGNEALVFVPGDTLEVDIVGNGDLSTRTVRVTSCELKPRSIGGCAARTCHRGCDAHLLAEVDEHGESWKRCLK